ncbi:unnamed protein product [Closterium sp. NIES-54]
MKSAGNESESRDDHFPVQFFFVSTQASAGPEKDEGFEEPAAVGKVTLHSLDYWVIDSGATYSMKPCADLLTELEPSPVKHVTSALGQRAEVKGMGKAMFKGADGKMVGLKNVLWVPNLAANLISVRRLQKAGMDTSSKGAKTYTTRLGGRILWDLHEDRDVYNEMWQIPMVHMPKERQEAASISTKGEAVGSGDGANGRAKEMKSKKCNLGGTSKLGEHKESGAAAEKQHKGEEKRVLRYLCSTSGMGLVLGGRDRPVLTGHSDASWADDQATQRSSQGYTFSLGSGSVSWRSTRSSSVLSSSCEAEIYATAMAAQELRWLTYQLTDLGEQPRSPPVLYVDNKATIALCGEHRLEHRTKHIALRYFLARELQQRGQLCLRYVATRANTADVFTKALQPCDHQRFCTVLGLVPTVPHLLTS